MPSAESKKSNSGKSNKSKKNRAAKTIQKGFRLTRRKPKARSTQDIPSELMPHIHGYTPRSALGASDKNLWETHKNLHQPADKIQKTYKNYNKILSAIQAIRVNSEVYFILPERLQRNREVIKEALRQNPFIQRDIHEMFEGEIDTFRDPEFKAIVAQTLNSPEYIARMDETFGGPNWQL